MLGIRSFFFEPHCPQLEETVFSAKQEWLLQQNRHGIIVAKCVLYMLVLVFVCVLELLFVFVLALHTMW